MAMPTVSWSPSCESNRMTQTERDQRYQAFKDWARSASVPIVLEHTARLMRGQTDPGYGVLDQRLRDVAASDGWHAVLTILADVQRERDEQAA